MSSPDTDMPKGFSKRVHQALRAYHARHADDTLDDLLLAHDMQARLEVTTPRLITNQVLLDGIDCLKRSDEQAADLVQRRFLDQETALEVAHGRNVSEDIIYQRQRAAIEQLAQVIWGQELTLRQKRVRKIEARLEPPTYTRLFGVADKMAEIRALLESGSEPWVIALEGLGGIGKTTLADKLVRELAREPRFCEIGWVSARRRLFHLSGKVEAQSNRPDLTLAELVDRAVDQFELLALRHCSDAEKLTGLRDFLRSHPCLVVADNLETAADYRTLIPQLAGLVNPTKFLITTRHSLRDVSGVYVSTLKHLSCEDTLALARHEADTRGLREMAEAPEADLEPIYTVTGGNPLATKLLVGQVHTLSLPVALERFGMAKGKPVEELLSFVYEAAWQSLDGDCRRTLQALLLVSEEGGRLAQIAAATELDADDTATCLHRLATLSLVNVGGSLQERRYALHQLTQAFVAQRSGENPTAETQVADGA
jgi:hypothetical protein